MKKRSLLLLGGAGVASITAALVLAPQGSLPFAGGSLMFPGLAGRLAQVATLEVRTHDATLLVRRQENRWVLPERNRYPVRDAKLRELLTGMTELRLMEPRPADAAGLARLGVDDPATPGSTALLVRLADAQGTVIAELIIGRRRVRTQGNVPETVYVRRPGEAQAWLAEGRVPVDAEPASWMDRDVANFPAERVRRVRVLRVGERPLVLSRATPTAPLLLTDPADPPQTNRAAIDDVARAFEFLTFMDAMPAAQIPGEAQGEARFELSDDLTITVWNSRLEQFLYVQLLAEGGIEADLLNARWRGWGYQMGIWKEKAFLPRLRELTGGS